MKRYLLTIWLTVLATSIGVRAEVKVIEGMPYIEQNGLRLYADVGKKSSIEIADVPVPKSPGEWWTVRAYLQNAGTKPISVLLGHEKNVIIGFPDSATVNVAFRILSESTVGDAMVKPPVGDLRLITLEPGEVAELPVANVQLKEQGKVRKMRITYSVDDQFAKWYQVWAGQIELLLDKDHPPHDQQGPD
jgi:hypothetical protein